VILLSGSGGVAVLPVLGARVNVGTKATTEPELVVDTLPSIGVTGHGSGAGGVKGGHPGPEPFDVKVKVVLVIVAGSIASLKVAVMFVLTGTPVLVSTGTVESTVGGVVSVVVPVVKVHVKAPANALPARSLNPVVSVAV